LEQPLRWTVVRPTKEAVYGKYPMIAMELFSRDTDFFIRTKTYVTSADIDPHMREMKLEPPFELTPEWDKFIDKCQRTVDGIYKGQ